MSYDALKARSDRSRRLAAHISATKGPGAIGSTEQLAQLRNDLSCKSQKQSQSKTADKPARKQTNATGATNLAPFMAITRADIDRARNQAVKVERARIAAVFASPDSKGRERGCVTLLTAKQNWSAAAICSQLAHLPTDAELVSSTSSLASAMRARFGIAEPQPVAAEDELATRMKARFPAPKHSN